MACEGCTRQGTWMILVPMLIGVVSFILSGFGATSGYSGGLYYNDDNSTEQLMTIEAFYTKPCLVGSNKGKDEWCTQYVWWCDKGASSLTKDPLGCDYLKDNAATKAQGYDQFCRYHHGAAVIGYFGELLLLILLFIGCCIPCCMTSGHRTCAATGLAVCHTLVTICFVVSLTVFHAGVNKTPLENTMDISWGFILCIVAIVLESVAACLSWYSVRAFSSDGETSMEMASNEGAVTPAYGEAYMLKASEGPKEKACC